MKRSLASDNNSGIHPKILTAITSANVGHEKAYGDDPYTKKATEKFAKLFRGKVEVYFTFNGTGANVLALQSATQAHHAIVCAESAHIQLDECGAPERFTGCKLLTVATADGKLTPELVQSKFHGIGDQHHVQPKVISISQPTEYGTLYTPTEIRNLANFAHAHRMILHVDGARISNAVAALKVPLHALIEETGVDILSFGGTKNGMMGGEAVIILNPDLNKDFRFLRKQGMQLASKMRFISAQFDAFLTDDLWLKSAAHANAMAQHLAKELQSVPQIRLTQKVEANGVFAIVPPEWIAPLQAECFFYVWDPKKSEVRWMCSFDTEEAELVQFVKFLANLAKPAQV